MEFLPEAALFNEYGRLKPQSAQQMAVLFFERGIEARRIGVPVLIERYGVSWVLLSMTIEFCGEIRPGESLNAVSGGGRRIGVVFRDDVQFLNERGEIVLNAALFLTVIDVKTRHVCRDEAILASLDHAEKSASGLQANSRAQYHLEDFSHVHCREVFPSWIDEVGHVGNVRYGEMAYDALSEERRVRLCDLTRYEIHFMRELQRGDVVELLRFDEPDISSVLGVKAADRQEIFLARFHYAAQSADADA